MENEKGKKDAGESTDIVTHLSYKDFVNNYISLMEHRNKNGVIWIHRVKEIEQTEITLKSGTKVKTFTATQQDGTEFEVKFFFDEES